MKKQLLFNTEDYYYKLDEDEYERICAEIADRKAAKEA